MGDRPYDSRWYLRILGGTEVILWLAGLLVLLAAIFTLIRLLGEAIGLPNPDLDLPVRRLNLKNAPESALD